MADDAMPEHENGALEGERLREVEKAAERFSGQAIPPDAQKRLVPQRGVDLTRRKAVGVVVCSAGTEVDKRLFEPLRKRLRIDRKYDFDLWSHADLLPGEEEVTELKKRLDRSALVLVFLDVDLLDLYRSTRLDPCLDHRVNSPFVIPVDVGAVHLDDGIDAAGLQKRVVFRHKGKAFIECESQAEQRAFVESLTAGLRTAIEKYGLVEDGSTSAEDSETRQEQPAYYEWAEEKVREQFVAPRDVVSPRGRLTSLRKEIDREKSRLSGDSVAALDHLQRWAMASGGARFFALLGEYGIGKTTTCQALVGQLLDARERGEDAPLPLYLDLRRLGKHAQEQPNLHTLIEKVLVDSWAADRSGLEAGHVVRLVREHGALVIFDGLDEVLVHLDPGEGQRFTRELWRILPPRLVHENKLRSESTKVVGRVMISCRTHYFRTLRDQSTHLMGEDREGIGPDDYAALLLLPFDERQIRAYLEMNVPGRRAEELVELLASVHNLTELAERPYLLKLISQQIERIEEARMEGDAVTGVSLYRHLVQSWLERDTGKHQLRPEHKMAFMEHLAARLWQSGDHAWKVVEVEDLLLDFLEGNPRIARHYRLKEPAILLEDLRTATFLVRPGEDEFRFAHTSLQEFFLALFLLRALRDRSFDDWPVAVPSLETLDFLGQMLVEEGSQKASVSYSLREIAAESPPAVGLVSLAYSLRATVRGYPSPSLAGWKLDEADLSGWTLEGPEDGLLDLRGTSFRHCHLEGVRFLRVDLRGADFSDANLQRAELLDSRAEGAKFTGARLFGTLFRRVKLEGTSWARAAIDHTTWYIEISGAGEAVLERGAVVLPNRGLDKAGTRRLIRLTGHTNWIRSSSLSADGSLAVSGGDDGRLMLWDIPSGRIVHELSGHLGSVRSCSFSQDGRFVASSGDDGILRLWSVSTGRRVHEMSCHDGRILSSSFSPCGRFVVSSGDDGDVCLWKSSDGRLLWSHSAHSGAVRSVSFSPDSRQVASGGSDGLVRLWDVTNGYLAHEFSGHSGSVRTCCFSPIDRLVVSGGFDGVVRLWSLDSGELVHELVGHSRAVLSAKFAPSGRLIASSGLDGVICLWDVKSGLLLKASAGHSGRVLSIDFSPDGRSLVSGGFDGCVRLWDVPRGRLVKRLSGHSRSVRSSSFSSDGRYVLSSGDDRVLRLWEVSDGRLVDELSGCPGRVYSSNFSPDGRHVVCAGEDGEVRFWDTVSGQLTMSFSGHVGSVRSTEFSPDGRCVVSSGDDGIVRLWGTQNGALLAELSGHTEWVRSSRFSPDGRYVLSSGSDGLLCLWDVSAGALLHELMGHPGGVLSSRFSPRGQKIVSSGFDGVVRLWDVSSGRLLQELLGHSGSVRSSGFSSDGGQVVSGGFDGVVRVWDVSSGRLLHELDGHSGSVRSCCFSPDSHHVMSGGDDGSIRLWELPGGNLSHEFMGRFGGASSGCFSSDGRHIVTSCDGGTIRLWSVTTGGLLQEHSGHSGMVLSSKFSSDDSRIVSSGVDGTIRIWDIAKKCESRFRLCCLPDGEWAVLRTDGSGAVQVSPGAWRWLGWMVPDPETGEVKRYPAETFGPLPEWTPPE